MKNILFGEASRLSVTQLRNTLSFRNPQSSLLRTQQPTTGPLHSQKYPIKKLSHPF